MTSGPVLVVGNQELTVNPDRLYELDLLRFLAAIAIILFHYTFRGFLGDMSVVSFERLSHISRYGYFAVPLFFMISGFVVFMTAHDRMGKKFVVARMSRLYPAYWICVTLTFAVTLWIGAPHFHATVGQYLVNLSMLQSFVGVRSIDGVYWTLAVELRFYFLIFLLLATNQIRYAKQYILVWLLLSLLLLVFPNKYLGFLVIPEWSWSFASGATFYFLYREGMTLQRMIAVILSIALAGWTMYSRASGMSQSYNVYFSPVVVWSIIALYFLFFSLIVGRKTRVLRRKGFLVLGGLTYPLFLLHQNIGYIVFNNLHVSLNKYLLLILIATGLSGSWIAISYIEVPASRGLRKVLNHGVSRLFG